MPRVTVIDHNDRRILLHDGTAVRVIPSDPYHSLKYGHFDGNRIFHAFGGDRRLRIEETYNDGIFNAYRTVEGTAPGGRGSQMATEQVVQISDALGLAKAVLADDESAYNSLFIEWYSRKMQSELVDHMIVSGNSDRVAAVHVDGTGGGGGEDGEASIAGALAYVVDGRFMVDSHGAAFYLDGRSAAAAAARRARRQEREEDGEDEHGGGEAEAEAEAETEAERRVDMKDWKYLCLVADERRRKDADNVVEIPGKGAAMMSAVTRVVIAKIAFLLYPADDRVFLNQLPPAMRKSVVRMIRDKEAY